MRKVVLGLVIALGVTFSAYGGNNVQIIPHSEVTNGQNTVAAAGTAEKLSGGRFRSVVIKALATNTGNVFVGDSDVDSANGFILQPGEAISLDFEDLAILFIDAANNDDGVSFIATK